LAADHEGDIGRCEIAVDLLQFKDLVIGNVGLGEQHVHVARHAPGDRMDYFTMPLARASCSAYFIRSRTGLAHPLW
jgi:hypothetical protein